MALHVFIFLLVLFLLLSLALLWRLSWLHLQPSHSRGRAMRSIAQRLLQPRTPLDCPACRLSCAHSSGMGPAPAPVRPWREVKSRRGAPKRVNTEGFACPNQQCPYFGITDAHIHASFWGWQAWPGRTDPDLSLSVLPHHVHCSAPHSPIPSENPLAPDRSGAFCARRRAGSFGCRACLRLPTSHHHHLADSRWGTCTDLARALLPQPTDFPSSVRRATHQAAQRQAGAVALASHRSLHQDSSRAPSRSPHAKHGPSAHPLPARTLGS